MASGQGEERVTGVKARPWPLLDDHWTSFHALSPTVRPRCQDDQWTAVGARLARPCREGTWRSQDERIPPVQLRGRTRNDVLCVPRACPVASGDVPGSSRVRTARRCGSAGFVHLSGIDLYLAFLSRLRKIIPAANGVSRLNRAYPCVAGTMEHLSRPLAASIRGWAGYCRRLHGQVLTLA